MASTVRETIKMVSTAKTGYYKTTRINKRNMQAKGEGKTKLQLMMYDPRYVCPETGKQGKHVLFKQEKVKS